MLLIYDCVTIHGDLVMDSDCVQTSVERINVCLLYAREKGGRYVRFYRLSYNLSGKYE